MSRHSSSGQFRAGVSSGQLVRTRSGRFISLDTQRAAARAYVKASEKSKQPVSRQIRDLASGAS